MIITIASPTLHEGSALRLVPELTSDDVTIRVYADDTLACVEVDSSWESPAPYVGDVLTALHRDGWGPVGDVGDDEDEAEASGLSTVRVWFTRDRRRKCA